MSIERDLITKILRERDLASVTDAGVNDRFFQDHAHREAFRFLIQHHREYSSVPTEETFKREFDPTYRLSKAEDALAYYVDTIRKDYSMFLLERGLMDAVDAFEDEDYLTAEILMAKCLKEMHAEVAATRTVDFTETGADRLERYKEYAKSRGALKGISSGFSSIDNATGGFQKKQLITFVGPPKAGKTTITLLATMAAHKAWYRPLFIGFEMSNQEQEERHDAIRAHISHKALRDGRLSKEDYEAIDKMMRRMESMPPMYFSEDSNSASTLTGIATLAEKYKPDILYIDGVYMMEDEEGEPKGSPRALTNITRGFKRMAQNLDIPIVITTQVLEWKMDRKRGVTSSSIGYSSSFAQDSDAIIAVEKTDEPDINKIKVVIARNAPGMETMVKWDWTTGEFEEMEEDADPEADAEAQIKF